MDGNEGDRMTVVNVEAGTRLEVTYELYLAVNPVDDRLIAMHHGICHTRHAFQALIRELNARGLNVVTIDQQSANAKPFKNWISLSSYRTGMKAALEQIEQENPKHKIMGYLCHSMGSLICEETQQAFPHLRHPTVFMTPIPINGAWPITWRILTRRPGSFIWACIARSVHSLVDTEEEVRTWFFDNNTPDQIITDTTKQLTHSPFGSYLELIIRPWWRPKIENDNAAKLLIYNKTDEIFDEGEYSNIRTLYPQIELKEIPGGHDFFIENAKQTAEKVIAFLVKSLASGPHEPLDYPFPPDEPPEGQLTTTSKPPPKNPSGTTMRIDEGGSSVRPPAKDRTQEERDRAKEREGESGGAMR